jgi:hypothetical protein
VNFFARIWYVHGYLRAAIKDLNENYNDTPRRGDARYASVVRKCFFGLSNILIKTKHYVSELIKGEQQLEPKEKRKKIRQHLQMISCLLHNTWLALGGGETERDKPLGLCLLFSLNVKAGDENDFILPPIVSMEDFLNRTHQPSAEVEFNQVNASNVGEKGGI